MSEIHFLFMRWECESVHLKTKWLLKTVWHVHICVRCGGNEKEIKRLSDQHRFMTATSFSQTHRVTCTSLLQMHTGFTLEMKDFQNHIYAALAIQLTLFNNAQAKAFGEYKPTLFKTFPDWFASTYVTEYWNIPVRKDC